VKRLLQGLHLKPGGWPCSAGAAPKEGAAEWLPPRPRKHRLSLILAILMVFVGLPIVQGVEFALWLYALVLVLPLSLLPARLLRFWTFGEIPARSACLFPENAAADLRRGYCELVLSLGTIWLMGTAVFVLSVLALKSGLGDQWNPLTRTISIGRHGPLSGYRLTDFIFLLPGFIVAATGFLWWPFSVLVEGLHVGRRIRQMKRVAHA